MQPNQLYFYTATIKNWHPVIRDYHLEHIITDSLSYLHQKGCINVYGFVIMPNHMHLIWELLKPNGKESAAASLMKFTGHQFEGYVRTHAPSVLEQFKVEEQGRHYNFWQTNPDWFPLTQHETLEQKLQYIHCNPMAKKWSLVTDPVNYYYSSCRFYELGIKDFDFLSHYKDWVEVSLV